MLGALVAYTPEAEVSLLSSALDKLKRTLFGEQAPKGPEHTYSTDVYTRGYNHCLKCGVYNPRRAKFTQPPCSEKFPPVLMELP